MAQRLRKKKREREDLRTNLNKRFANCFCLRYFVSLCFLGDTKSKCFFSVFLRGKKNGFSLEMCGGDLEGLKA